MLGQRAAVAFTDRRTGEEPGQSPQPLCYCGTAGLKPGRSTSVAALYQS